MRRFWVGRVGMALAGACVLMTGAADARPETSLQLRRDATTGAALLKVEAPAEQVVHLESSSDLAAWKEWLVGHGSLEGLADLTPDASGRRFYRARVRPKTATDDWKNAVHASPEEPFQSEMPPPWNPGPRWIKFALLLDQPDRVYFQDSAKHLFHYDFARARLPGFEGMTRAEFDAVTLRTNGQRAVLGAVLVSPPEIPGEVGIQFVGQDAYPRESIAAWYRTVRSRVLGEPGLRAFYIPTYEQSETARREAGWLADHGVTLGDAGRWVTADECYAPGWTLGRLVFVPAGGIPQAYQEGRLRPIDVLLTDQVPAEVPPLAGIITLEPATPNSHVALLAKSFGIPFVRLADPRQAERLRGLDGREVMVRGRQQHGGCEVDVLALARDLDPALRAEILAFKAPPPLDIPVKAPLGRPVVSTADLGPADARHVGGKAANFGVLLRSIPQQIPTPSLAVSLDLWDAYLQQRMPGGQTLGEQIAQRLSGFQWPPDMRELQAALEEVRRWVSRVADFSEAQKQEILAALQAAGFDPAKNIRFRSSTNMEDSEQFSGAGLYDSFSGCLADDLDADGEGPSHCDPTETGERGVFRAMRRVYGSFYNDNAFLERLRHGVKESDVGMAILVHPSVPDVFELANGVATLDVRRDGGSRYVSGRLVSQLGAVSVANPDSTARPEQVRVTQFSGGRVGLDLEARSSLVALGDTVLAWPGDYEALHGLLDLAARRWETEVPGRTSWLLDFEYKKVVPGRLEVKQIRPLPLPVSGEAPQPWLLDVAQTWVPLQGEHADLMALHRLKSTWAFAVRPMRLLPAQIAGGLLEALEAELIAGTNRVRLSGLVTQLPGHTFAYRTNQVEDSWDSVLGRQTLRVELDRYALPEWGPLASLADYRVHLGVRHTAAQPVLEMPGPGEVTTGSTREEWIQLVPRTEVSLGSKLQQRDWKRGARRVQTTFYWPPEPKGVVAGYTAPLQAWVETRIEGFTSAPIVLRGFEAQTYQPGHHNFWEQFLFDPFLEPGVDAALLDELRAANLRAVVLVGEPWGTATWVALGWDGRFRMLD